MRTDLKPVLRSFGPTIAAATATPVVILLIGFALWECRTRIGEDLDAARLEARAAGAAIAAELQRAPEEITAVDLEKALETHPAIESAELLVNDQTTASFRRSLWSSEKSAVVTVRLDVPGGELRLTSRPDHARLTGFIWRVVVLSTCLLLGLVGVGLALGWRFSRFLDRLTTLAQRLAEGNLTARGPVAKHELGQLGRAINSMADKLSHQQEELVQMRNLALDAARRAREADQAKSAFLADLSHEIRTPMTAILGYADLLLDPRQPADETKAQLFTIRANAEHLLAVINDTLDHAKIEAGHMDVERIDASPATIVAESIALLRGRADDKGLALEAEFPDPLPEFVQTDPTRLRQILVNLIGNALKFTEQGSVRLVVRFVSPDVGDSVLAFQVIDTGIGMTAEHMETLFRPYAQAERSTTRQYGGTGLGLTISQRLAALLGGGIHVESTPGHGSTFTLAFKVDPSTVTVARPERSAFLSVPRDFDLATGDRRESLGLRVLVVDDNSDVRELIGSVVRRAGCDPQLVCDGETACARIAEDVDRFEIVLLDMRMPGLSGQETARRLRHLGYHGKIVALTAAIGKEREEAIHAGCDDHFSKPFQPRALIDYLRGLSGDLPTLNDDEPESSSVHVEPSVGEATVEEPASPDRGTDEDFIESEYQGDPEMDEYIAFFVERLPERLQIVESALREGDLDTLVQVAHDLKGIAGTVGYPALSAQAEVVEQMATLDDTASVDVEMIVIEADELIALGRRVLRSIA